MNDRVPIEIGCFSHIFVKVWESLESCAHAGTVVARTFARTHVAPVCHAETGKKGELARTSAFGSTSYYNYFRISTLTSLPRFIRVEALSILFHHVVTLATHDV